MRGVYPTPPTEQSPFPRFPLFTRHVFATIPELHTLLASLVVFAVAVLPLVAQSLRVVSAAAAPELSALYQRTNGWVGADANYSVPFSPARTLLFFGDTWIGQVVNNRRTNVVMINNSVGVLHHGAPSHIDYFWRTNAGGKAAGIFLPEDGRGYLWPFGGVVVSNQLHLLLHQIESTKEGGAFGFKTIAVWLATVSNAQDAPAQWRITQARFPFTELSDQRRLLFGAAMMPHAGFVYVYGTEERLQQKDFGRQMVLARVEAGAIGDFTRWTFFTAGGWTKAFQDVTPLAPGVPSESSVTYLPTLQRFVFVGNDAFLSPRISARSAPQPWGPWSAPMTLYDGPEAKWNKNIFCYAGKAHPSLSAGDELIISYAANSFSLAQVVNDARLYWPQLVRVRIASPLSSTP